MNVEHFEIAASVLTVVLALHAFNVKRLKELRKEIRKLTVLGVEHEMLVDFMCEMTGRKREDMATRHANGMIKDS